MPVRPDVHLPAVGLSSRVAILTLLGFLASQYLLEVAERHAAVQNILHDQQVLSAQGESNP